MPSLTPQQHADETVWAATKEGMASGGLVMIPSALAGATIHLVGYRRVLSLVSYLILLAIFPLLHCHPQTVYSAMKFSPKFVKSTNWQSRTAMVIMPPFFAFVAAAEHNLVHSMQSMASTAEHSKKMAEWSRQHELDEHQKKLQRMTTQKILGLPGIMAEKDISTRSGADYENQILAKFRESVVNSGVRVVPGDSLGFHHKVANFWQENPFKILAAIGGMLFSSLWSLL